MSKIKSKDLNIQSLDKVFKLLIIAIVVLCMIIALLMRLSIIKNVSDFTDIDSLIIEVNQNDQTLNGIKSTRASLKRAKTIIVARFTGVRESAHNATLSVVLVERVLKGDASLKNKEIEVYENNALSGYRSKLYLRNFTPNNFFQNNKSYLIFLDDQYEYIDEYKRHIGKESNGYPMTDYYLSCFCIEKTDSVVLSQDEQNIVDFKEYSESEFIVFSEKQKQEIYEFKEEILKEYM